MLGEGFSGCIREFGQAAEVKFSLMLGKGLRRGIGEFGQAAEIKASFVFGEGFSGCIREFGQAIAYETSRLRIRKMEATSSDKSTISMHW